MSKSGTVHRVVKSLTRAKDLILRTGRESFSSLRHSRGIRHAQNVVASHLPQPMATAVTGSMAGEWPVAHPSGNASDLSPEEFTKSVKEKAKNVTRMLNGKVKAKLATAPHDPSHERGDDSGDPDANSPSAPRGSTPATQSATRHVSAPMKDHPPSDESTREVSVRLFIDAETSSLELLGRIEQCIQQILEVNVLRNSSDVEALSSRVEAISRLPLTSDDAECLTFRATPSSVF